MYSMLPMQVFKTCNTFSMFYLYYYDINMHACDVAWGLTKSHVVRGGKILYGHPIDKCFVYDNVDELDD